MERCYIRSKFLTSCMDRVLLIIQSVAVKLETSGTKTSVSASIEGRALVKQYWFNIIFQPELSASCLEVFFKRPSPFRMLRPANMVALLNIYKIIIKLVLIVIVQRIYSLLFNKCCARSLLELMIDY